MGKSPAYSAWSTTVPVSSWREEKLRMSEINSKEYAHLRDAIIMIDNEGRVSYWNEAAEKMFGRTSGKSPVKKSIS